jgi:hypothetical protein
MSSNVTESDLPSAGVWITAMVVLVSLLISAITFFSVLHFNIVLLVSVLSSAEMRRGALTPLVVSLSISDVLITVTIIPMIAIDTFGISAPVAAEKAALVRIRLL